MENESRREFFVRGAAAVWAFGALRASAAERKFTIAFTPGSIGIRADQRRSIELASKYGYGSVQPFADDLTKLSDSELGELRDELRQKNLVWAAAGLPVDFRRDAALFEEGMAKLPAAAKAYERAGVDRIGTYMMPIHAELTYLENFKQTAQRLSRIAAICGDHGLRLGLEYVGTPSILVRGRYPFVHTMAETKELIAETGKSNVGFVLDTWHWWTAGDKVEDLLTLSNADIVSADLNDAPQGLKMIEQQDGSRELPAATGVIDVKGFLDALVKIGYDGPIRPEPFNKPLNDMDDERAAQNAAAAMKRAFAMVG